MLIRMHSAEVLFIGVALLIYQAAAQAQNCGTDAAVYINASDAFTTYQPWQVPFGTTEADSQTWAWELDTVSYNMNGPNGSAEQRLWLSTQDEINLIDPAFGFLGCGMILHGLRHGAIVQGQDDTGSCSSVFNPGCLSALQYSTNMTSQNLTLLTLTNGPNANNPSALEICSHLANLGTNGNFGLPEECSGAFLEDAWIQTFGVYSQEEFRLHLTTLADANLQSSPRLKQMTFVPRYLGPAPYQPR
jgi:hypothetical protein